MSTLPGAGSERIRPTRFAELLVAGAVVGAVVALVAVVQHGFVRPWVAVAFGALIAVGELMSVRLPGDRPVVPIANAGALGYALLFDVGGRPIAQGVAQVVVVVMAGSVVGSLTQLAGRRHAHPILSARRIVLAAATAALFHATAPDALWASHFSAVKHELRWVALLMVGVVAAATVLDVVLASIVRVGTRFSLLGWTIRDEFVSTTALSAAVGATGTLTALATPPMQLYALPLFCVPLLLTQFAFRRYAAIRTTYRETIRSLSRVAEVGGYVEDGHAHRVSTLAVEVARDMGLTESVIGELEYAALLHDIGQLSLTDPIPNGSTLLVAPVERRRVAELGAEVIKTTGVLDRVAEIVARQADPYRRHREAADHSVPIESRIIKAASAYDDLVGPSADPDVRADALERLRLGMAYEYDPQVVETLTRVVTRSAGRARSASGAIVA